MGDLRCFALQWHTCRRDGVRKLALSWDLRTRLKEGIHDVAGEVFNIGRISQEYGLLVPHFSLTTSERKEIKTPS
jgi:hypothetical protein